MTPSATVSGFVFLAACMLLACSCSSATGPDVNEAVVLNFSTNPFKTTSTAQGRFTVTSFANTSGFSRGTNAIKLVVADMQGQPVNGLEMTATPFMPSHGHGSSVVPKVQSEGDGNYLVAPLLLSMSGQWEVRIKISDASSSLSDSCVLQLDVP